MNLVCFYVKFLYNSIICNNDLFQVLEAMGGKKGVVECAYVKSDVTSASYFATPLLLGVSNVILLFYSFSNCTDLKAIDYQCLIHRILSVDNYLGVLSMILYQ